jgi:hypothetical protein
MFALFVVSAGSTEEFEAGFSPSTLEVAERVRARFKSLSGGLRGVGSSGRGKRGALGCE